MMQDGESAKARRREAADVVQELLDEMTATVRDYHPSVGQTSRTVVGLIQGTAFFPGGSGLWRGPRKGGALPHFFPDCPVMLVAHNYDSIKNYTKSLEEKGEVESSFWRDRLLKILAAADIGPESCFFTNVLMGLQPETAVGPMPATPQYIAGCKAFLIKQIKIVRPRTVVTLGGDAKQIARSIIPLASNIMHPSAREFGPLETRSERLNEQGMHLAQICIESSSRAIEVAR